MSEPGAAPDPSVESVDPSVSAPSTALALRSPAGLTRAPSFYATGHADQRVLLSVLMGGPLAAAGLLAAVPAVLGVAWAAAFMGMLGLPIGLFAMHWYHEDRGKQALERARVLHSHSPDAGRSALAAIAGSRGALPEVRLEAAARLAIEAFEAGDVAAAIQHLDIGEQDHRRPRRRRSWPAGARGELMRAVLAWLSPDSFADYGVAEPEDDAEAAALLAALRVLEAASRPDDAELAARWDDTRGTDLATRLPTLHAVITAVAAERLAHLADALHERVRDDASGTVRALLRRLFPRMQLLVDEGYRGVSPDLPATQERDNLDIVAPEPMTALARRSEHGSAPVSRMVVGGIFASVYGTAIGVGGLLGAAGGSIALGLLGGFMLAMYAGTPMAAVWGGTAVEARENARRVAPLGALRPGLPPAWLLECASGPPGPVVRSSGYRRLSEIPLSQMTLYVACARAEQALARGEPGEAWHAIEWWFAGFVGQLPGRDPMYAVGSTLLRVAVLSGHLSEALAFSRVVPEHDNPWDEPRRRTAYGNAPRALALARALLAAHHGEWAQAAGLVDEASRSRPVFLAPHDAALYAELVRRIRARGHDVAWTRWSVEPRWRGWVAKVWAEA